MRAPSSGGLAASLQKASWFLTLLLELPQKESPAFDVFVPCLFRLRAFRVAFMVKGELCSPVWHWAEEYCDPGYVDGFMIPITFVDETLNSDELRILVYYLS